MELLPTLPRAASRHHLRSVPGDYCSRDSKAIFCLHLWEKHGICFQKIFVYLFICQREREHKQGKQGAEGEADSLLRKVSDVELIPGPWNYDLSLRQMLHQLSNSGIRHEAHK